MPLNIPSGLELNTIRSLANLAGKRVVEIGTGDGRLAWPLAPEAAQWVALDPAPEDLALAAEARKEMTAGKEADNVRLLVGDGRALGLAAGSFDVAFFSWSLC